MGRQRYPRRKSGRQSISASAAHSLGSPGANGTPSRPAPAVSVSGTAWLVRLKLHLLLLAILFVFVLLAALHSLIVPLTQGEDELAHYRYLGFIAQTGRLPVNQAERQQAWYRSDWPPLYHLLVGWAVSPLDTTRPPLKDVGESPHRRLVGHIFYPRLIIYTEDASWPWQEGVLAWHTGRFISILLSTAALAFVYLTGLELGMALRRKDRLPLSPHLLAALATAVLAFTPRYVFTSAMLGDDSMLILLSAAFIWLLLRALWGDDRWRVYAAMGLLLGLSIATKYSTGLLPLLILPVALWRARQAGWSARLWLGRLGLAWLFTAVGAGWWFGWIVYHFNTVPEDGLVFGLLRPLLASGPDVSMRRVFAFFTGSTFSGQERPAAIAAGTFWDWLVYLFQTYWGVPILEQDPVFPWAYLLLLLFCLAALVGLGQVWRLAAGETRLALLLLVLVVAALLPFPVLRFFLTRNVPETGQGRHLLYPAAQAAPLLLALGLTFFSERIRGARQANLPMADRAAVRVLLPHASRVTLLTWSLPALLLLWSLFQLGTMATSYPEPLPVRTTTFDPGSIAQPLRHSFGPDITFLGYDYAPEAEQAVIHLTLFWQAEQAVGENYRTQVQLVDEAGRPRLTWLSHPVNGRYPTRAWDRGDIVRDAIPLPLAGVPAGVYNIQVNLLGEAEDTALLAEPFQLVQFTLPAAQPIPGAASLEAGTVTLDYRLWAGDSPARYRQTLPLSWSYRGADRPQVRWTLLGPDNLARPPVAVAEATAIFMVGADWPSGLYRLQAETGAGAGQSQPLLAVANEARLFEMPPLPENWTPVDAVFAGPDGRPQVKLLGYFLPARRVEPGAGLPLTLYWQSLAPVLGEYMVFDVLLDEQQVAYGGYDRLPREYYSPILWAENEIVEDGFAVPVAPAAPPGVYTLHVGLYYLADGSPVSLHLLQDDQVSDATSVAIGPIKVGGPPPGLTRPDPAPQTVLDRPFGGPLTLLGYNLEVETVDPAEAAPVLKLSLYWRAEAGLSADYTTVLHLRDAANQTVAQKDGPPAAGRYPSSLWDQGEVIVDEIELPLAGIPPGQYTPVIGLYEFATGARLPVPGSPAGNELALESVTLP